MAEEKSAPKKEKAPKAAAPAAGAEAAAPAAATKPAKAPKAAKPAADGSAPAEAAPAAAAPEKPVELIGGVAKQPTAEDLLKEELGAIKVRKAKGSKNVTSGVVNVLASFNNTIVSITDQKGQVIAWSSAGKCNFRGSRKSTAYAAQVVAQDAARNAMAHGLKDIVIRVPFPTTAAVRASVAASKCRF
jgi:small subunit ribosomal protein S11